MVVAVGEGVSAFAVGDEVYGRIDFNRDGAAAEYVAVPVADIAHRPASVSHPPRRVGGAGGVGAFAVQLARYFGATVSATARGSDLSFVIGLGADVALDYTNANDNNAHTA